MRDSSTKEVPSGCTSSVFFIGMYMPVEWHFRVITCVVDDGVVNDGRMSGTNEAVLWGGFAVLLHFCLRSARTITTKCPNDYFTARVRVLHTCCGAGFEGYVAKREYRQLFSGFLLETVLLTN